MAYDQSDKVREFINESIRAHINSCGAKFGTVVYFKKEGELRRLTFNQAAMPSRITNTDRGIKASATKRENHPNLMTAWDVRKRAFRTVNLDTVLTVQAGGKRTRYRHAYGRRFSPGVALVPIATLSAPGLIKLGVVED